MEKKTVSTTTLYETVKITDDIGLSITKRAVSGGKTSVIGDIVKSVTTGEGDEATTTSSSIGSTVYAPESDSIYVNVKGTTDMAAADLKVIYDGCIDAIKEALADT